jgi:hypothetical protein
MGDYLTLHNAAALLAALALGGMVFYSFVVTPLVFRHLDRSVASGFLAAAFPVYYRVMLALTAAAALLVWYRGTAIALGGIAAGFLFLLLWLLPRIARTRAGRDAGDRAATLAFRRLHGLSVLVNLAQIAAVTGVFLELIR